MSQYLIPFNKPYCSGKELEYIREAIQDGKISGDGAFTRKCTELFTSRYGFKKVLLTTSCTDALEMASLLIGIKTGDEVIMPSYTFVSTANPFVLRGATIKFIDSRPDHPNLNEMLIEELITDRTKAIVPVHYAGVGCDMNEIKRIATKHRLFVVEDAAQCVDSYYDGMPLGSLGDIGAFSFHETKNVICGEGGMITVNNPDFAERAEVIREKGTNRSKFFRGEVDKYGWVDVGSSYLLSDLNAAYLFAQLEIIEEIQSKRLQLWNRYYSNLKNNEEGAFEIHDIPVLCTNNAHMFYIVFNDTKIKDAVITALKSQGILAVFHYLSLHKSEFYKNLHDGRELPYADFYSDHLLRLPLYYELELTEIDLICDIILTTLNQFI
ncbi:MAG TPA: dTDP-4-amino-4,6-dideoxygalactose transaminase [Saprospiraceae bacterium]|nr:dTDP-4-amino-4,6-dideoxygalactose transaminase [Saprospiraceae bacterium]